MSEFDHTERGLIAALSNLPPSPVNVDDAARLAVEWEAVEPLIEWAWSAQRALSAIGDPSTYKAAPSLVQTLLDASELVRPGYTIADFRADQPEDRRLDVDELRSRGWIFDRGGTMSLSTHGKQAIFDAVIA